MNTSVDISYVALGQREVLNWLTSIEKALNKRLKTRPGQVTVKSEEQVDPYYN